MRHELMHRPAMTPRLGPQRSCPRRRRPVAGAQATSVSDRRKRAAAICRLLGLKARPAFRWCSATIAGVVKRGQRDRFQRGQRGSACWAQDARGAHASHVVVPQALLRPAPYDAEPAALAVLPYSFTTMWLALRSAGLAAANASGARVLIHGANGALGRLALQVLVPWGSRVTAICAKRRRGRALGAERCRAGRAHRVAVIGLRRGVELRDWDDDACWHRPGSRLGHDHGAPCSELRPAGMAAGRGLLPRRGRPASARRTEGPLRLDHLRRTRRP
jgi:hypothetical protein